jgi:hypothetical protein
MQKTKKVQRSTEVVQSIECDNCCTQFTPIGGGTSERVDYRHAFDGISLNFQFSWPSNHDGERYAVDLCEKCTMIFIKKFSVKKVV